MTENAISKMRILIVEDEIEILQPLYFILTHAGYSVHTARTGVIALQMLAVDKAEGMELPDILITDLHMPGISGLEMLAEMTRQNLYVPAVLAISGDGGREDIVALMRWGVADYLDKPFSLKTFLDRVKQLQMRIEEDKEKAKTKTRELESENRDLRLRMRQLQGRESLSRVTRGILHDVNNCLAIITGSAEMIKLALAAGNRPVDGYADSISNLTERAMNTLQQLHALNRLGEGLWTCFDLHSLVDGTLDLTRTALGGRFQTQSYYLPGQALVQGDAVTLQNALIHMLLMVRDTLGETGGTLKLTTDLKLTSEVEGVQNGWITLRLEDDGPGIDQEVLQQLLAGKVESAHGPKPFNLNHAWEALRSQGGDLQVQSTPGRGLAMWVDLPAAALPLTGSLTTIP
jgi:DNA-binding response OmpR family regulator